MTTENAPSLPAPDSALAPEARRGIRWWPLALLFVAGAATAIVLWLPGFMEEGRRNLATQVLAALFGLASVVWLLAGSRMAWRNRARAAIALAAGIVATAALVEVRGLRGDLWLDVGWRWSKANRRAAEHATELASAKATADLRSTNPDDFPRFLGADGRGELPSLALASWTENAPALRWSRSVGKGWSGFVVVGKYAVTQEQLDGQEYITCYAVETGEPRWKYVDPSAKNYESVIAGDGPRATPTIADGVVYATSVNGRLRAIDGETGKLVWAADVYGTHNAVANMWGCATSPLVVDDLVVTAAGWPAGVNQRTPTTEHADVPPPDASDSASAPAADSANARESADAHANAEGSTNSVADGAESTETANAEALDRHPCLVAYRRDNGELAWSTVGDASSYSSPVMGELCGVRQILYVSKRIVAGYDPSSGRRLWKFDWLNPESNVCNPLPVDGTHVFCSSGYGWGAALIELGRGEDGQFTVREVWRNNVLKAKFTNVVHRDGFIYGLDDGILACIEAATGKRRWKKGRYGHGQLLLAGDKLVVQAETGELVLVAANPERHEELGTFSALGGKTWNNPALAGSLLLTRNDHEAVCVELTRLSSPAP